MPTFIPSLSTDAMIVVVLGAVVVYGVITGAARLTRLAISVYVGLVIVSSLAPLFRSGVATIPFGLSQGMANIILLTLPILLLQFGSHHGSTHAHKRGHYMPLTILLATLTALLIIASVVGILDAPMRKQILLESNLASQIYALQLAWIVAVPVAIAAMAFIRPKKHH